MTAIPASGKRRAMLLGRSTDRVKGKEKRGTAPLSCLQLPQSIGDEDAEKEQRTGDPDK